jgi:hypothetical protein
LGRGGTEVEVDEWFDTLDQAGQETAAFYVDLLAERGVLLDEPYTRQLRGKLRELRFNLDRESVRISYWIAPGRRIRVRASRPTKTRGPCDSPLRGLLRHRSIKIVLGLG